MLISEPVFRGRRPANATETAPSLTHLRIRAELRDALRDFAGARGWTITRAADALLVSALNDETANASRRSRARVK